MIPELERLQRKSKWTDADRKRIQELSPKRVNNTGVRIKLNIKPVWMSLDEIHTKFVGKVEPWTVVRCTTCDAKYHLMDGASCDCGKEESKARQEYHLGGSKIGTTK